MNTLRDMYLASRVFAEKDAAAFEELFDKYAGKVRSFLVSRLPRTEDADDLTADVFLRSWEYLTASRVEKPAALFFRVARNLVADFYRRHKETVGIEAAAEIASKEDLAGATADREEADEVLAKIANLREEYAEILLMHYVSEMKPRDIASVLGKTPNGVRILLHRAKKALQEVL